jgi:hypothetical protein
MRQVKLCDFLKTVKCQELKIYLNGNRIYFRLYYIITHCSDERVSVAFQTPYHWFKASCPHAYISDSVYCSCL